MNILICDDIPRETQRLAKLLKAEECTPRVCGGGAEALVLIEGDGPVDVCVMMIARLIALAVNITTMFRCMRPKYGIGFSLAAFVGCAALGGGSSSGCSSTAGAESGRSIRSGPYFRLCAFWGCVGSRSTHGFISALCCLSYCQYPRKDEA